MQFTSLIVAASALVAGASAASNGTVYTTEVHTAYTTVCPAATQLTFNGQTYTVTESTTLTITNCPCTVVKPVTTYSSVICSTCPSSAPAPPPVYVNSTSPAAPVVQTTAPAPAPAGPTAPAGTAPGSAPSASTTPFISGGNRAMAASGAGLAALLGLAAYIL